MFKNNKAGYHDLYRNLTTSTQNPSISAAWDGKQWVSNPSSNSNSTVSNPNPPPPRPSTDLPKVPSHIPVLNPETTPISDLVTHYSEIYQHYAQQVDSYKATNDVRCAGYKWAEYYADLSTRAAHHYNDYMQKQQVHQQTRNNQQSHNGSAGGVGAPPKSFQEYAHRNLSRCIDHTQKSAMTELIQMTIRKAVQDRTMHTKHWDKEPLLPLPTVAVTVTSSTSAHTRTRTSANSSSSYSNNHFVQNSSPRSPPFTSSSPNCNSTSNFNSNFKSKGKSKSFSYMDALTGSTNHVSGNSNGHSNSNSKPPKRKSSSLGPLEKKSRNIGNLAGGSSHYDNTLPENDSYYGSPMKPKGQYDNALPENDSYYGRGSNDGKNDNNNDAMSNNGRSHSNSSNAENVQPSSSKKRKKSTKKNQFKNDAFGTDVGTSVGTETLSRSFSNSSSFSNNNVNANNSIGNVDSHSDLGDYISLSSLSSTKYIKKKNKLVKANSVSLTTPKKKKQILIQGVTSSTTSKSKLVSRLNRFSGQGSGVSNNSSQGNSHGIGIGLDRYMGKTVIGGTRNGDSKKLDEDDYESMTVKGTCDVLEKEYLRLTAPPRAELVRPQGILRTHLCNIKNQWEQYRKARAGSISSGGGKKKKKVKRDYTWFCSQLKAIRQDLTVQRIFNDLAVEVYETHARIALEEGDLNEYNQSQTQLKELYELVSHNEEDYESLQKALKNQNEFIAYRIIYYVFLTGNKKYEGGSSDLFKIMLSLSSEQSKDPSIVHALKVRVAVADNDYHAFFRLQDKCPNLGAYLMDMMIDQVRATGLQCMMKAYRPSLSVEFILEELGFGFHGKLDVDEGIAWLMDCGCKLNADKSLVLTKDSILNESNLIGKKASSLI
jgi:hypothetical protein